MKKSQVQHEVRDAVSLGDPQTLKDLVPHISALGKDAQEAILSRVVRGLRVDLVQALEGVEWKTSQWRPNAVLVAAEVGSVDTLRHFANDVEPLVLRQALAVAALRPGPLQWDTVAYLAPLVHSKGQSMVLAGRNALMSLRQSQINPPADQIKAERVLGEMLRYQRVEALTQHTLKTDKPHWTAVFLPVLAKFVENRIEDAEFVALQSTLAPPRPGKWRERLSKESPECEAAISALEAQIAATRLHQGVEDQTLVPRRSMRL